MSMYRLLKKVNEMYKNDEEVTDSEEKIVYEFVGLLQLDEGLEFEETVDLLIDVMYDGEDPDGYDEEED